jgi:hypothetical protein
MAGRIGEVGLKAFVSTLLLPLFLIRGLIPDSKLDSLIFGDLGITVDDGPLHLHSARVHAPKLDQMSRCHRRWF